MNGKHEAPRRPGNNPAPHAEMLTTSTPVCTCSTSSYNVLLLQGVRKPLVEKNAASLSRVLMAIKTVHSEGLMWPSCSHPCPERAHFCFGLSQSLETHYSGSCRPPRPTATIWGPRQHHIQRQIPCFLERKQKKTLRITIYARILNWLLKQVTSTLLYAKNTDIPFL